MEKRVRDNKHDIETVYYGREHRYVPYFIVDGQAHYYKRGEYGRYEFPAYVQAFNFIARKRGLPTIYYSPVKRGHETVWEVNP